jgi:hypothetical protein
MKSACWIIGGVSVLLAIVFLSVARSYVPPYVGWVSFGITAFVIFGVFFFVAPNHPKEDKAQTISRKEKTWAEHRAEQRPSRQDLIQ